jgi:pimeloyl-ACP methyl ester carboxylesterase
MMSVMRMLVGTLSVMAALCVIPYIYPVSRYKPCSVPPHANGCLRKVDGVTLYSRLWEPAGEISGNVFLVHGFGSSTYAWGKIMPALLASGYRVVAADVPGFGYSEKNITWPYSHERNGELMWALLGLIQKERGLPERGSWTLVGHSMGGEIVIRMAKQRPEAARQAILAAGAVVGRRPHAPPWLRFPPARQWAVMMIDIFSRRPAVIRRVLGSAYGRTPAPDEVKGYAAPISVPGTIRALFQIGDSLAGQGSVKEMLKELRVPIALIWGENDRWVTPFQGRRVASLINQPLLLVSGAGHCPMETHPDAFAQILLSAMRQAEEAPLEVNP